MNQLMPKRNDESTFKLYMWRSFSPTTTLNQPKIIVSKITKPESAIHGPGANWFSHNEVPASMVNSPIEPTIGQRVPCGT